METQRLLIFAASFFFVALSPGLCMTLAMSLGIRVGVRRTLWMMAGELLGIALVGTAAVLGVAVILLQEPTVFTVFKLVGAAYLFYMAWQSWQAPPFNPGEAGPAPPSRHGLATQGFVTAVANPKAWAFFVALLPPFVDQAQALAPQLASLLLVILLIEFCCLLIYAFGGRALADWLHRRGKARWLNRIAALLMAVVGLWLLAS